jgi:Leucine rich repeat/Leucine Rich repeat
MHLQILELDCFGVCLADIMDAVKTRPCLRQIVARNCRRSGASKVLRIAPLPALTDLLLEVDGPSFCHVLSDDHDEGLIDVDACIPVDLALMGLTRLVLTPGEACDFDRCVARLTALTMLRSLKVSAERQHENTSDDAFASFAALTKLTELDLQFTRELHDNDLTALRHLSSLQRLDLGSCWISEFGLRALATLTQLRDLDLEGALSLNKMTGVGGLLCGLSLLSSLSLACSRDSVTDADLVQLAALSNLLTLDLESCDVTDEGLATLLPLPALQHVRLEGCRGVSEACRSGWDVASGRRHTWWWGM